MSFSRYFSSTFNVRARGLGLKKNPTIRSLARRPDREIRHSVIVCSDGISVYESQAGSDVKSAPSELQILLCVDYSYRIL